MNYILIIILVIGLIVLIALFLFWLYSKGNQDNTIKTIRMIYKSFKRKNPDSSNHELTDLIIKDRYRFLKTKLFTDKELSETLNEIKFDWQNERQLTYVLGSLIWALENKRYSEKFKQSIEFACELDSEGIQIKFLKE